jgi:hypothetical protein
LQPHTVYKNFPKEFSSLWETLPKHQFKVGKAEGWNIWLYGTETAEIDKILKQQEKESKRIGMFAFM